MAFRLRAVRALLCISWLIPVPLAAATDIVPPPAAAPVPEQRPDGPDEPGRTTRGEAAPQVQPPSEAAPVPQPRPVDISEETEAKPAAPEARRSIGRHNAAPGTLDARAQSACRARLGALDVAVEPQPPLADPQGCSLPAPLAVSRLSTTIAVEPPAVTNCAMAETAARFMRDVVSPAAQSVYGSALKSVAGVSGYTCRPRNGTTKLSEHAFGNALDISRFVFADGTAVDVGTAATDDRFRRFLQRIRAAACGPFKTVLGPGSDADHADHLHVDLATRRNGATFCQ